MTMTKQTITALYDTRVEADRAAAMLKQAGVPALDITVSPDTARDELGIGDDYAEPKSTGFWASLDKMFGGTDDHGTYTEGLRRGGTLLTAHVDETHVDRAIEILEQHGSVDLDERETSWRGEGWTSGSTAAAIATPTAVEAGAMGLAMGKTVAPTTVPTSELRTAAPVPRLRYRCRRRPAPATDDMVQVVEERLNVGKRSVSRGKVRLHAYVVETAVSENVSLRDETVTIDRRPVDRAVSVGELGVDAFRDRTIEMEEIDEEAVVGKSARVVEEIGIRKDVTDRTETIRDTVRSTKVDIEDGRTVGTVTSGLAGDFRTRLAKDMEVVGSDGRHVGVIDHVDGDTIKLKKMDPAAGGQHHLIMVSSVASVADKVMLKTTAQDTMARWTAAS